MFAKLFETARGQILVKLDVNDDEEPEVRFYAQPPGLGVCSFAFGFKGDDGAMARRAFLAVTEEDAIEAVATIYQVGAPLMSSDDGTPVAF